MIVAFDLDDTLYPEITYVHSGFRAVATWLHDHAGVDAVEAYATMIESLEQHGRGKQFDDVLEHFGLRSSAAVRQAVAVYRGHVPAIELDPAAPGLLTDAGRRWPLYLVTDGNHRVQARKVEALAVRPYFRHCYLTYRYGRSAEKPSPRVFELMAKREKVDTSQLVYVGDNPVKDFVGVRRLGGRTIRVLTGGHADVVARRGYDADVTVDRLADVGAMLEDFDRS